jgi:hypothetical protein
MPQGLTVLAAIRPGEEERLRYILRAIGDDINGKRLHLSAGQPRIDFPRSRAIHFARFAILDDPDRGPNRKRLLYSSNYDGDLDAHLDELAALTSDMHAIWGACEAYPGTAGFIGFMRAHAHEPEAFYIAFRDNTAEDVRQSIALRRRVQPLLDAAPASSLAAIFPDGASGLPDFSSSGPAWAVEVHRVATAAGRNISAAVKRLARALPVIIDLPRAVARCGFVNVFRGTQKITATIDRVPAFRRVNRITRNRLPPMHSNYSSVDPDNAAIPAADVTVVPEDAIESRPIHDSPTFREDVITQNQLTLITDVRDGQVDRVRAVMSAINSYSRRLAPPGSLIGVSTIHFVRWLLLDGGRRLMMVSDYDGSWESYIDEFAELILSGLDAIWETCHGYPPDGARDVPALKRFLRSHQVPSDVFYSAYPDETILNIVNDRALVRACQDQAPGRVGDLLARS